MATCEHDGCDEPKRLRSPYCTDHKAARRRESNKLRMRRKREDEAADKLLLGMAVSDGRSIPRSPDSWTPPTQHHPSRRFARQDEPAVVDYLTGATQRESIYDQPASRPDLQRYRPPRIEADAWAPPAADYYSEADFRSPNDMSDGPYGSGHQSAGVPVAFQVVRRSR